VSAHCPSCGMPVPELDQLREELNHARKYEDRGDFLVYRREWDHMVAEIERLTKERDAYRRDAIQWAKGEHLATGRGLHSDEDAGVWVDRNVRESLGFALEDKP
jgi:hypothetical protein